MKGTVKAIIHRVMLDLRLGSTANTIQARSREGRMGRILQGESNILTEAPECIIQWVWLWMAVKSDMTVPRDDGNLLKDTLIK